MFLRQLGVGRRERGKGEGLALGRDDRGLFWELENQRSLQGLLAEPYPDERGIYLQDGMRGEAKLQLIRLGHPVPDMAGYKPGDPLPFELAPTLSLIHISEPTRPS